MPGMVMRVEVAVGDTVAVGQGVVIVEAMKMENELKAPAAARVASVEVQAGVAVEKDQVLVTFAPLDEEDA
jgi:biotin carboxyl carrier protein